MKTIEELIEKYPKIFKDYKGNPGRVNWSCPTGWLDLVDRMCGLLQFDTDNNNHNGDHPQVECLQIKEKFGGLRFYTTDITPIQEGTIKFTENLSHDTCMECGSMKNVRSTTGWIANYCEEHFPKETTA